MRYLKILFLSMMVVGLIASGAFAGSITFLGPSNAVNTPYAVALEALGAARTLTYAGAANSGSIQFPGLWINPGQALLSGSLVTISFTNLSFDGSPVYLCQLDTSNNNANGTAPAPVASATPSANSTSQSFVLTSGTATGNRIMVTTNANSSNCMINGGAFIYKFQPIASAAMSSVTYNVTTSGTVYDSGNAANNVANISRQYSTAYNSATSYIDFLNAPANGSKFSTNTAYTTLGSLANIANAPKDVSTTGSGLTVSALISLQDSASWQGVTSVYARNNASTCGSTGTNNAANNSLSGAGTVNLSLPAAVFDGAGNAGANVSICAQAVGNAVLQTRTIKAAVDISVAGTGPNDPAIDTYQTIMQWQSNGYQGTVPYISAQSNYKTICFVNNKSVASAPVTADILTSESGATLSSLTALSIGTLAAGGTMRVDFESTITPYTYSGGTESAGTAVSLTGLQSTDRYSAMINVGASPVQVTVSCIQLDPAGSKRAVPVLTQNSSTTYNWQQ